jgi:hypothetical protein
MQKDCRKRQTAKMSMVGSAMHKLLRQAFGVLKSKKPFDPNFLPLLS